MNSWHNKQVRYLCRYGSIINISAIITLNGYQVTGELEMLQEGFTSAQCSLWTSNRLDVLLQVWRHVDEELINIWKIPILTHSREQVPQGPSWRTHPGCIAGLGGADVQEPDLDSPRMRDQREGYWENYPPTTHCFLTWDCAPHACLLDTALCTCLLTVHFPSTLV